MNYSFDIFDTCLIRACGMPRMVFSLTAQRINPDSAFVADFCNRRVKVEAETIKALKKEAVTLSEIYDRLDTCNCGISSRKAMEMEMSVEEEMLLPVRSTLDRIETLRNDGNKDKDNDSHSDGIHIIFISDMYLPTEFLQKVLQRWGFWQEGDRIFVSGDCGATKRTGQLFRHVAKALNISFRTWKHFGDNPRSDIKIPRRLGIKTERIKLDYSRYEKQWLRDASLSFDGEMCRYTAGVSRAVRFINSKDERVGIAADVIASAYIPFVFHIFNHARQQGFTHLFFTARDSRLFYQIAQRISHLYPEIRLSYIFMSRRALWLPSLYDCEPEAFLTLGRLQHYSPYRLLTRMFDVPDELFFKYADACKYAADGNAGLLKQQLSDKSLPAFMQLLQTPEIREHIRRQSTAARTLLLRYLRQEQALDNSAHAAIVDLGWGGSCRFALNKILTREGYAPIYTYYFGVSEENTAYSSQNRYNSMMVLEKRTHFIPVFEQYFSITTQSSTVGYAADGIAIRPVFEEEDTAKFGELCAINTDCVLSAVELLLKFPDVGGRIRYAVRQCGLSAIEMFFKYPSRREVEVFQGKTVNDIDDAYGFVYPHILRAVLGRFFGYGYTKIFWISGSILASFPLFGRLYCKMLYCCLGNKYCKRLKTAVSRSAEIILRN